VEADREAGLELSREAFPEGRWLTYSELAEIRSIGRPSAVKLAHRERWRRIPGNDRDRTVRVLVPPEWLQPSKAGPFREAIPEASPDAIPELARQLEAANARADDANNRADAALTLADRTLAQRADADARADRAEEGRRAAEGKAERAEAAISGERQRSDALRMTIDEMRAGQALMQDMHAREVDQARAEAQAAQEAADELRRTKRRPPGR
jgi:hypothetical protein